MSSPYGIPVFYNQKKNRTFRPLFDYHPINKYMVKDVMPLPCIDTIIEDTKGAILFSKFDLHEGYYNIRNSEELEDILAFKTTQGLYAPIVMPFGPTNCPAIMQRFMNHIFKLLYNRYGP